MLDAATLIREAEGSVGIADSDNVIGNLERLLASVAESFPLSPAGEQRMAAMLRADAVNRLESLRWLRDHPEIAEEPIDAPVFLMGLPRSGTTYFQYLFDRDPRFRLIRTWESTTPSPPPGFDPASVERRRAAWRAQQEQMPFYEGFEAVHLMDDDGSTECHMFLEQSWGAAGLHNFFRVPAFFDWLLEGADLAKTYRIHRRQLQCLQWRSPRKPWALKYPNHALALNEILAVHPDARFVMTHRDPAQTLASIAKLTRNLRGMSSATPPDARQVGTDMLHMVERQIERTLAFDAGPHGHRVIHVDYYALVADPVGQMRRIHAGLGIGTPDEVAEAVGNWHAANPRNARGTHDYTLEEFGLDLGMVRERFGDYARRFAIPTEAEGLARIAATA